MFKLLTVIGARPQIIKSAAINRVVNTLFKEKITEILVHTGQHYDENMSDVFFNEMGIAPPKYNLNVGSASHAQQTAKMMIGIEELIIQEKAAGVLVYGDTNSTVAAALSAAKLSVPVFHVEAGLRSYNKSMPEEINRVLCDHISTLLFVPTQSGMHNLKKEGFNLDQQAPYSANHPKVYHCGDVMYDNSMYFAQIAKKNSTILTQLNLQANQFMLITIHRNNNTDDDIRLNSIIEALIQIAELNPTQQLVFPIHPRTQKCLKTFLNPKNYQLFTTHPQIKLIAPQSFLNIIALEENSSMIITDSGGLQKEAFFFKKPCVILRPQTEWVEIVENGNAKIVDADKNKILDAVHYFQANQSKLNYPSFYGDGKAAEFIVEAIVKYLSLDTKK